MATAGVATQSGVTEQEQREEQHEEVVDQAALDAAAALRERTGDEVIDERESEMDRIARRNDERIAAEHAAEGLPAPGNEPPEPTPTPSPAPKAADSQLETQLETDAEVLEDADLAKIKVRTTIDGKEEIVTALEMKRRVQKAGAADKRLEEASALLRDARAAAAANTAGATPPPGDDAPAAAGNHTASPAPVGGVDMAATGKEFLDALFGGDETKAAEALNRILAGRAPGATPQSKSEMIAELTPAVKQQLAKDSALDAFATEFKDIVADPYLADLADRYLDAQLKDHPEQSYAQSLTAAGKATRGWLASKGVKEPAEPAPTAGTRAEKLARKASAASNVVPGLNQRATVAETAEENPSSVIAEMRAARGMEP